MMKEDEWKGCYDAGHKWAKLATTESNQHPAKMSWGLLEHILRHLMKEGILHFGDTVLDPMAGTGRTALAWIAMDPVNNKAITVELEPKFVELQVMNKVNAERMFKRTLNWTILTGDARLLSSLLKENNLIGLTSPPYEGVVLTGDRNFQSRFQTDRPLAKDNAQEGYSPDPKNIGNCPDKPVVLVSPPYANRFDAGNEEQRKKEGTMQNEFDVGGYSDNPNNIGNLKDKKPVILTSPPYGSTINGGEGPNIPAFFQWAKEQCGGQWPIPKKRMRELSNEWQRNHEGYSLDEKNIGNAKDRPPVILTSPPYPTQSGGTAPSETGPLSDPALLERQAAGNRAAKGYGDNENNLGNLKDEKKDDKEYYLDAMNTVYAECAKVCRALITVTKNPTRNHALRRLDLDTKRLLEVNHFEIIGWYKARLFYLYQQMNLEGEGEQKVRGRMSFFKHIQLKKGSPVSEHEDVLIGMLRR